MASKDLHIFQDLDPLDSLQHLALAELCRPELLSSAVFLEDTWLSVRMVDRWKKS